MARTLRVGSPTKTPDCSRMQTPVSFLFRGASQLVVSSAQEGMSHISHHSGKLFGWPRATAFEAPCSLMYDSIHSL